MMSDAFDAIAIVSVREAIEKANALGLPIAYGSSQILPAQAEIVRITLDKNRKRK